jgi:hypothetical protein
MILYERLASEICPLRSKLLVDISPETSVCDLYVRVDRFDNYLLSFYLKTKTLLLYGPQQQTKHTMYIKVTHVALL